MKPAVLALVAALSAATAAAVPAPVPAPANTGDSRQLGEAVLTLSTKRLTIERALLRCGEIDPVNVPAGHEALAGWDERNAPFVALLPGLLEEVHRLLAGKEGEAMWLEYRHRALPMRQEPLVRELADNLDALAVEDRPYFCTELLATLASGKLDFAQEAPINVYLRHRLQHPPLPPPPPAPAAPPPPPAPPAPPAESD